MRPAGRLLYFIPCSDLTERQTCDDVEIKISLRERSPNRAHVLIVGLKINLQSGVFKMAKIYIAEWIWYMNCYRIFQTGYPAYTFAYSDGLQDFRNHNLGVIDTLNPNLDHPNYVLCELDG